MKIVAIKSLKELEGALKGALQEMKKENVRQRLIRCYEITKEQYKLVKELGELDKNVKVVGTAKEADHKVYVACHDKQQCLEIFSTTDDARNTHGENITFLDGREFMAGVKWLIMLSKLSEDIKGTSKENKGTPVNTETKEKTEDNKELRFNDICHGDCSDDLTIELRETQQKTLILVRKEMRDERQLTVYSAYIEDRGYENVICDLNDFGFDYEEEVQKSIKTIEIITVKGEVQATVTMVVEDGLLVEEETYVSKDGKVSELYTSLFKTVNYDLQVLANTIGSMQKTTLYLNKI